MISDHSDRRSEASASRSEPRLTLPATPDGLEQRLLQRARASGLTMGDRLVVGFSGGRDSLALAAGLRRVSAVLDIDIRLVHVDHRLRPGSADEARQAVALADTLGMPVRVVAVPEARLAAHRGVGVEEAARRERYRLLANEARAVAAGVIATAHQREDQAESVLLHLLRGAGVHGARGMAEWSPVPGAPGARAEDENNISPEPSSLWLWRPLLQEPRSAIDGYVAALGLEPIDDPSNDDAALRRNALRHSILPRLETAFPGASAALARYASLAAEDDRLLDDLAREALATATSPQGALDRVALCGQPLALQRRMVRRWHAAATGLGTVCANRVDAIIDLARRGHGGSRVETGEGWFVTYQRGALQLTAPGRKIGEGSVGDDGPRSAGVARILIDGEAIEQRTAEMAKALDEEYGGDVPLLIGVLNGACTFMTDLMRAMRIPLEIDFMAVSSYGASTKSSGVVRILKDLDREIEGRRVIVVEDIVDSGLTLQYLLDVLERRNPKDLRVVALLKKEKPDAIAVQVDQVGFTIPDEFVVGYGLDYAGKYRNLPYVAVLDRRVYAGE